MSETIKQFSSVNQDYAGSMTYGEILAYSDNLKKLKEKPAYSTREDIALEIAKWDVVIFWCHHKFSHLNSYYAKQQSLSKQRINLIVDATWK